jgi:hypothetical protein
MVHNVGTLDRVIRIVIGLGILSMLYLVESSARWWGLVGLVPLVSGIVSYCPFYHAAGVDTIENTTAAQ